MLIMLLFTHQQRSGVIIMSIERLKVKQAVLKAVRKLSGAAFSKDLGDYYISFNVYTWSIDMVLWLDHEIVGDIVFFSTPENVNDIPAFERKIESEIAKIFNHVANNPKG